VSVYEVLHELGIEEKDTLLVLNKIDGVDDPARLVSLRSRYPSAVEISAKKGIGLAEFAQRVSRAMSRDFVDVEIEMSVSNGRLMAYLAKYGEVLSETYAEERLVVHCRISQQHLGQIPGGEQVQVRPYKPAEGVHVRDPQQEPPTDDTIEEVA
jgi:GTP-binding protein HflX